MLLRYTVQAGLVLLDFFLCDFTLTHYGMDNPWLHLSSVGGSKQWYHCHAISHVYGLTTLVI